MMPVRPQTLTSITARIEYGEGKRCYAVIAFDGDGAPHEVFLRLAHQDPDARADAEAIARLVSLALRSGVGISDIVVQLRGIKGTSHWHNGDQVLSLADSLARLLAAAA